MSNKRYSWKRFWCPRSGSINLADGGYLYDPDAELGKAYNPDLVSLEAFANASCLVLLGEPGIGKSQELKNLKVFTEEKICNSSQILELNLRSCTNLKDDLFKDEAFINWLGDNYPLYLFLDSFDEGLLGIPTLASGLVDELKKPKYKNHINHLHLRLACRTFVFSAFLEKELENLWEKDNVVVYELAPLRRVDVIEATKAEGFSSDNFLVEIKQKDVVPLALKPITLGFLLNTFRRHNGQFPKEQKLHELYLEGCRLLCEEVSESRRDSGRVGSLDSDQRLIVAARIAAVTIFTNRFAVWTDADQGNVPDEDVPLSKLCFGCEKANGKELKVSKEVIKEVLDTGLFSSRGPSRMGWAHQTYAEFLAAWYVTQHELFLEQIKNLLFCVESSDYKLIPQLHETAAWLASMRTDILQEIIETDPDVLLQTDVPAAPEIRALIVENLLKHYERQKLSNRGGNHRNYSKLKHPKLVDQLRSYICDTSKQLDARDIAIDIAEVCKVSDIQNELVELALDSTQSIYLRASAVNALCSLGDADTRRKLKPLAIEQLLGDESDDLKGYALKALWPDQLKAEELFQSLTPPKRRNFFGGYQGFLVYNLVSQLEPIDLETALNWLELQGLRCSGHPFEKLGNNLIFKAWENFSIPGVAASFTRVAIVQWEEHQHIITNDSKMYEKIALSLSENTARRHILIDQAVLIVSQREDTVFLLSSLAESISVSEDIFWMIERLQSSTDRNVQWAWGQLVQWKFNDQDAKHIDAVITASQSNDVLQEVFASWFTPVDLNSSQANELKDHYFKMQERQVRRENPPLLDPTPRERVLRLLEKLEAGDLSAWWQLNIEMTLKPESLCYNNEFELDLTKLPGWQEGDKDTRRRIIEGAKKYVQQQDDVDYSWIGTNTLHRPSQAGCRAFLLLLLESLNSLEDVSSEVWKRWTPIIVSVTSNNQHEDSYLELVKLTYLNAPDEFIRSLIVLIDKKSQENEDLFVLGSLSKCWDKKLNFNLLEKIKDSSLKPKCVEKLLEELIKQEPVKTRNLAKSLIVLPSSGNDREKALVVARIMVENSEPLSWSFVWNLIQNDLYFGREVIESVACRYSHSIQLNITETQLSDLYIWLVNQYPYNEDPDHSNEVMAHIMTARDGIVNIRDNILSQLKERGTLEACNEILRIIQEFPDMIWLHKVLINAQINTRRKTWQPFTPEEFLRFVVCREPSHLDLSDQINEINQRTKKMEDEPKIRIDNSNSPNSPINAPIGSIGVTQNNVNITSSDTKKRIDWGKWLSVIGIVVAIAAIPLSMSVSGAFNVEFKEWFNHVFSPKIEQKSAPKVESVNH